MGGSLWLQACHAILQVQNCKLDGEEAACGSREQAFVMGSYLFLELHGCLAAHHVNLCRTDAFPHFGLARSAIISLPFHSYRTGVAQLHLQHHSTRLDCQSTT